MSKGDVLANLGAEARGKMYRFLSSVYLSPPNSTLLRQLVDDGLLSDLCALLCEGSMEHLMRLPADAKADEGETDLKQEFMSLFAVPTGRYVVPFEDVYWGIRVPGKLVRGPLLGERAVAAKRTYRAAGAEMDGACKELPTHIGVELGFMSFLCEQQASAVRDRGESEALDPDGGATTHCNRYREHEIRFLEEHLNAWFPQLSQAIQENAQSPLYRDLALITERFLRSDATQRRDVLSASADGSTAETSPASKAGRHG